MILTSSPFLKPGWTTLLRIWRWKFQAMMYIALIAMKRLAVAFVHMFENLIRLNIYMTCLSFHPRAFTSCGFKYRLVAASGLLFAQY